VKRDEQALDSLRPMACPALPKTIRPKPRAGRLVYATMSVQLTAISMGAFFYLLFLDPALGDYRLYCGLVASLVFISSISALVTNLLLLRAINKRP